MTKKLAREADRPESDEPSRDGRNLAVETENAPGDVRKWVGVLEHNHQKQKLEHERRGIAFGPESWFSPNAKYRLVDSPSEITRRALDVISPHALYLLLQIDSLGESTVNELHTSLAERGPIVLDVHEIERDRWLEVENHLAAACRLAAKGTEHMAPLWSRTAGRAILNPDNASIGIPGQHDEISALDIIGRYAAEAHYLAEREHVLAQRAGVVHSPKATKATSKERVRLLEEKLKPHNWTRSTIAELIIASLEDWIPPPVDLASVLYEDSTRADDPPAREKLIARLNEMANPNRADRRR